MCENCNRIESSQCHIFFGWFSQGKSNDWKEIWLELYLEGINCQSNVPNPWPELIYLRRSGKPGRKSQIHKVHPKWGLSRGRLMIPIRELGSGIGDRIAGSGTADEPFDRLSVSQSVNWHFLPPFHFIILGHTDNPIKLSRLVLLTIRTRRCLCLSLLFYLHNSGIATKILFLPLERKLQK